MGSDGAGGAPAAAAPTGADGAPVDQHGTMRDFGNMLNAYTGTRKKKHGGQTFSPWANIHKAHKEIKL